MRKRILVATAHPDDADIMAGGTVARWLDEGHEVHSLISREATPTTRTAERPATGSRSYTPITGPSA